MLSADAEQQAQSQRPESVVPRIPEVKSALLEWGRAHAKKNKNLTGASKGAVRIIPGLYLGNAQTAGDAATLANLRVGAVCSVGPKSEKVATIGQGGDPPSLMRIAIADDDSARLLPHLRKACEWIDHELGSEATDSNSVSATSEGTGMKSLLSPASQRSVLVHCRGGMNRSPAVIAAYLIWKYGFTAPESMEMVKVARPAAQFGRGAQGVLQQDLHLWGAECAGGG